MEEGLKEIDEKSEVESERVVKYGHREGVGGEFADVERFSVVDGELSRLKVNGNTVLELEDDKRKEKYDFGKSDF